MISQANSHQPEPATTAAGGKKISRLLGVAVISTIAASACCVLPLVLVLLGLTGAWMTTLTSLAPYTPLFGGITLAALAWAGWLLYRPAAACDGEEQACETTAPIARRIFLACVLFAAAILGFPLIAPLFY
jgi:mercuric ion transport protein